MDDPIVPTLPFSPAKSQLSELMNQVFHRHALQLISRHGGKEQMLLVRPDDLLVMLGDQQIEVEAVYDPESVTLNVPAMGVLGFGDTLDEALDDLVAELRAYASRFFRDPARYWASGRGTHAGSLLRFALADPDTQRAMLMGGVGATREPVGAA